MAYVRLQLPDTTPSPVRRFVEERIENLYFSDVHAMFRLPLPDKDIHAGLNFAITQVLMSVVSGVSCTLYDQKGESGELFKAVVEEFFPWSEEPRNDATPKAAAGIIYDVFRNPLAHAAGLSVEWRNSTRYLVQKSYTAKVKKRLTQDKTAGHTEQWIEDLERSSARPTMGPTLAVDSDSKVLLVEGFYWCTRRMIQKLLANEERMRKAERYLKDFA